MKKYNFFKQDASRPTEEQRLLTKLFYQNSVEIYARFDDWKDIDKFYFIPLYLEMTYSCGWKGHEGVSDWQVRAVALRDCLKEDKRKWWRFSWFRGTKIAIVPGTTSKLERCE